MQLVASLKALQRPKRQITRVEFYWMGCNIVVRYWREWAQTICAKTTSLNTAFPCMVSLCILFVAPRSGSKCNCFVGPYEECTAPGAVLFVQTTWLPRKILYPWPISISSEVSFFFPRKRALAGVALFLYIQWNLVNLKPVEPRKIFVLSGSTNYQKSNKNSKNHVRYFS